MWKSLHQGRIWFLHLTLRASPPKYICWWADIELTIHTVTQNTATTETKEHVKKTNEEELRTQEAKSQGSMTLVGSTHPAPHGDVNTFTPERNCCPASPEAIRTLTHVLTETLPRMVALISGVRKRRLGLVT